MAQDMVYIGICFMGTWKNVYSADVGWSVPHMSIRTCWLMLSLSYSISLLTFCLVAPSVVGRGVLKPPTTVVDLSISPFYSISVFTSRVLLLLFCAHIWDCYVFLVGWPFIIMFVPLWASQVALVVKNLPANAGDIRDLGSIPGLGGSPGGGHGKPTLVFLPEESQGQRSLAGYSQRVAKSWTRLKQLGTHVPLCCFCCCRVAAVVSDSVRPHRRQLTRLPRPWDSPGKNTEWVAISFSNAWKGKVKVKSLSCVRLFATPRTVAHQALLSMGFSRQEYWSGVPWPSPVFHSSSPKFLCTDVYFTWYQCGSCWFLLINVCMI